MVCNGPSPITRRSSNSDSSPFYPLVNQGNVCLFVTIEISCENFNVISCYLIFKDIRNVYMQAPSYQKNEIVCGPNFGLENVEKIVLILRALYMGKSAGRNSRNNPRSCM